VGILNIFGRGDPAEKAKKLKAKVTQKYGDPAARQKAIQQLGQMKVPEAVSTLLSRFTIAVEPQTTDADEKDQTFELVCGFREEAVQPTRQFLFKNELATSWALRVLGRLVPEIEVTGICVELLGRLAAEYTRNPEKKVVVLHHLTGKEDPRIAPAVLPFLEDMADDVKIAAVKALGPLQYEPAREPLLRLLTAPDTAKRVQTAALQALHESAFGIQGYREKVEALVSDPFFVDKSGLVKRRS
jgi:HEAT repeat protein